MDLLRSLPLGLYLEQPTTWLHRLDARVKLAWLLSFLMTPVVANAYWRLFLVALLIGLTLAAMIPLRVWRQQMGWLLTLGSLVFVVTAIAPDGLGVTLQPRLPAAATADPALYLNVAGVAPPDTMTAIAGTALRQQVQAQTESVYRQLQDTLPPSVPRPAIPPLDTIPLPQTQAPLPTATRYRYELIKVGPLTINQRSLELGIRVSTLLFTLIYGTNLFLLTTAPEEITAGLERLLAPLQRLNVPVTEIVLTLTLSLRFIPLVLEEVQNLVRSIRTRAINWKKLGWRGAAQIWIMLAERVLGNLLLRAEQIASAMQARGFTSPNQHQVRWHRLRLRGADWVAIAALVVLLGCRLVWGQAV